MSSVQRAQWLAVGLMAFLTLVFFSILWRHTSLGGRWDPLLASPLIHDLPWTLRRLLSSLGRTWLPLLLAVLVAVLWISAVAQRHLGAALTALLVPSASLLMLVQIRDGWLGLGVEDFPSGHTTAACSLLVSVVVLWPRPASWATLLWTLTLIVVAVGNVTLHAHLPGEVIAAVLLVSSVTGLLLGILAPRPVTAVWSPNRGTMGPP
ncbi:hypothetical protein FNH13_11875 [Ornithinimicrobium ciconiae]|uniref:Phosphatase PAP2 family protein n=1 Tax=Ornithinimicrobium ciconiae TaxID=2594265 RepID=A0A516GBN7_9MICO|nr:phosphatase PAP2 family protein [Ornithinimicrobium ciconiae]QDO88936.1 hypothetical protein FNH13_11875 [Ornithinimicrobium ciconiae]